MKKIIHIDADSFYASVEIRENPELKLLPIAVGGNPNSRGVIATCNYEARKFGIHSAMSSAMALKLCPSLRILPPRMSLYREYSLSMREIFSNYTDKIEPLSLDEAYLDVSDSTLCGGSATFIAKEIKEKVFEKLKISVSAGVAPVKYLAKIASDWDKPDGLYVISPKQVDSFVLPLSVKKLPGVGPVTAKKLAGRGIFTCADIQKLELSTMVRLFGTFGRRLYEMSYGIDERGIDSKSDRKSISVERTYASDMHNLESIFPNLEELLLSLDERFEKLDSPLMIKKLFVKIKFNDFSITTIESAATDNKGKNNERFHHLLSAGWQRQQKPVRLIGVGYRLSPSSYEQLPLPFEQDGSIRDE